MLAIAPPIIMKSILVIKNSIIFIFVDIFAPPTNAATGLTGDFRTDVKAVISSSSNIPENEGKKFVIACKLA